MKNCAICNKHFFVNRNIGNPLYCGADCRKIKDQQCKKAYYERNKELVKLRSKIRKETKYDEIKKTISIWRKKNKEKLRNKSRLRRKNLTESQKQNIKLTNKIYNNTTERKLYMKQYRKNPEALIKERASGKKWSKKNKHIEKNSHLIRKFGINLEIYNQMLKKQNNVCKICKKQENKRDLAVDHCHKTGIVRGLLCFKCNSAIGKLNDDVVLLESALSYLKEYESNN